MKKLSKFLLIALGAASVLGATGCVTVTTSVATNSNWYLSTKFTGIQPTSVEGKAEELKYSVSLKAESSKNDFYKVEYDEGAYYTTKFYAVEFDWQGEKVFDDYKAQKTETVYVFETELKLSGKYIHKDGGEVAFDDFVTSVCYFKSAAKNLAPIYSKQVVASTSPVKKSPKTVDEMTERYEYSCTTYYNQDCSEATVVYDDFKADENDATKTVKKLNKTGYSVFDNAGVIIAMRAMDSNEENFAKPFSNFISVEGAAKTYGVSRIMGGNLGEGDETIKNALVNAGYVEADKDVAFNRLDSALQEDMQGATNSYWFAAVSNEDANSCRSTLLKMATPLSFNLGVIEYELEEVISVLGAKK